MRALLFLLLLLTGALPAYAQDTPRPRARPAPPLSGGSVAVPPMSGWQGAPEAPSTNTFGVDDVAQRRTDPWIAPDKFRHFFAAYGATAFGFAISRLAGADRDAALAVAIGGAAIAGFGKEIADVRRGGFFSVPDLVWDAGGILAGVALVRALR